MNAIKRRAPRTLGYGPNQDREPGPDALSLATAPQIKAVPDYRLLEFMIGVKSGDQPHSKTIRNALRRFLRAFDKRTTGWIFRLVPPQDSAHYLFGDLLIAGMNDFDSEAVLRKAARFRSLILEPFDENSAIHLRVKRMLDIQDDHYFGGKMLVAFRAVEAQNRHRQPTTNQSSMSAPQGHRSSDRRNQGECEQLSFAFTES